jgi:hypothetical protein
VLIFGTGLSTGVLDKEVASEWRAEDLLIPFFEARSEDRDQSRRPIHDVFCQATTDEKLIEFLRSFGPVAAMKVKSRAQSLDKDLLCDEEDDSSAMRSEPCEQPIKVHIVAIECLTALRLERRLLYALRTLLCQMHSLRSFTERMHQHAIKVFGKAQFNRVFHSQWLHGLPKATKNDQAVMDHLKVTLNELASIGRDMEAQGLKHPYVAAVELGWAVNRFESLCHWPDKIRELDELACSIFNQIPVRLYAGFGSVAEFPETSVTGVRPLLYYMLRADYLQKRAIRLCANERCGRFFAPKRSHGQFCSEDCTERVKQRRKYYRQKSHASKLATT